MKTRSGINDFEMDELLSVGAEIEDFIAYKISHTGRIIDRMTAKFLSLRYGFSVLEWHILGQIAIESPMTVFYLAERTGFDKGTVSRAITSLLEQKLIHRTPDARDRRSWLLTHTPKGRALYNEIFDARRKLNTELRKALSEEEFASLLRSVDKIQTHLRTIRSLEELDRLGD